MFVEHIKLLNFRNYQFGEASFVNGANVIYGRNALGKTNVLEAIYLLATSKSHRQAKERELIQFDKETSKISIDFFAYGRKNKGDIILSSNKKKQFVKNLMPVTKTSELMGFLNVVMFCPEDLRLVKGSPRDRRRMMDISICQLRKKYFKALLNYNKVLEQKNNLLRENPQSEQLWVWNDQLSQFGSYIAFTRQNYINNLQSYVQKYHFDISNEKIETKYISGISQYIKESLSQQEYFEIMQKEIEKNIGKERKQGQSLVGPHRDDFCCVINEKEARLYGSQGQQRTIALCLKLAEVDLIRADAGEPPVLLLDDALSELDENRQEYILKNFNDLQTIITCTHQERLEKIHDVNLIRVEDINVHTFGQ